MEDTLFARNWKCFLRVEKNNKKISSCTKKQMLLGWILLEKTKIGRPHSIIFITLKFCKKRLVSKPSEKIVIEAF